MSLDFDGRVALVTGAGSAEGIGFASAKLLASSGARVAITSTTKRIYERLDELSSPKSHKSALVADLTDGAAATRLAEEVRRIFGRVDILINNAGMIQTGRRDRQSLAHKITDEEWRRHLDLNLFTSFAMTRAVLRLMIRKRYGRIVNIASVTGPLVTNPRMAAYSAAKAGMMGFTRGVAIETAAKGITANAIAPGWIATASATKMELKAGAATPIGRSGRADEIAAVVVFLASEGASYITGQMIVVDGGNSIQEFKGAAEEWY